MRVAILGCGSMGTILGAFLNKNGCPAEMIDNYEAHVKALNEKGAQVVGTQQFTVPVKAITPDQMEGIYDLVFLFTKQTANEEVLPKLLPHLSESSTVCTLQNGVPEPFVAKYVGQSRTVGGTVLWSATFQEPGISCLTQDVSNLNCFFDIGEIDGSDTPRIHQVAEVLSKMGPAVVMPDLMAARWGKLVNNACVSGMSAACGTTFGGVIDDRKARACLAYLGHEVKICCEAEGLVMPLLVNGFSPDSLDIKDKAQYEENQKMWADMYAPARPAKASMLQDLEKGKLTEVTMINGYVSEVGRKHGIPTPFNDTVVKIVQGIERGELPLSFDNLKYFDQSWFTYGL
ncbi:ketopantoate reductase family protein [Lawsonibacter celer]|uniref:ketopantoate reductase family protein n=1 Tax=Lawsonibacter celer TaxID=2986526 RepID=UPI0016448559|nr:ketopantoate reductase family protein [Lawsonibacter celer]